MNRTTALAGLAMLMMITNAPAVGTDEVRIELDLNATNDVVVQHLPDGGYSIETTGKDPFILSKPVTVAYDPATQCMLSFDYFCEKGLEFVELFYGPPIRADRSATGPEVLSSEGWTSYAMNLVVHQQPGSWRAGYRQFRLDLGSTAGRTIQIRNLRLRPPTAAEQKLVRDWQTPRHAVERFDAALRQMTAAQYDHHIERVSATDDNLRLTVQVKHPGDALFLCEVPFYQSPVGRTEFVWSQALPVQGNTHQFVIERFRGDHDRVFSSWIVMRKSADDFIPASHPRFVEDLPAKWALIRDRALSRKGLTGMVGGEPIRQEDYRKMGIRNATKNIVLPGLISEPPIADSFPHTFNGVTVHVKTSGVDQLDKAMLEMEQLKILVSAIILIPKHTPMSHPDCADAGIYAMANVVEADGWATYAAGLDFLAQRYLRPDRKYGRITHWIMHNEVDAGWIWTNAGEKPLDTYLDLYYRSMRTAQSVIRRYGNAGQVLMSLTHYWTARHNRRCYPSRDLVDLLARRSALEGDFDWGLAYHPYPENLRDPRTWQDKTVSFDFNTPRITPRNLEVLDAYMRQPGMLCDGKVRTIVLSEQGLNSPDHSEQSYRDQAAGLIYTWLKLEKLDSIESFIHHRWTDHPQEGGLNLGLRRRPETSAETALQATRIVCAEIEAFGLTCHPDETSKPAWDIYRVLETPEQPKAVEWMRSVIPKPYWP